MASKKLTSREKVTTFSQDGWQNTVNFFVWKNIINGKKYFVVIDNKGQLFVEKADNGKKRHTMFIKCWKLWAHEIFKGEKPTQFEYPVWFFMREIKGYVIGCLLQSFLVCSTIVLLLRIERANVKEILHDLDLTLFLMFILLLCLLVEALLLFATATKGFWRISVNGDILKVNFLKGYTKSLPIASIRKFHIGISARNARITFNNGTSLNHLERVSYWPILREYLLSKLEASEKTEDK